MWGKFFFVCGGYSQNRVIKEKGVDEGMRKGSHRLRSKHWVGWLVGWIIDCLGGLLREWLQSWLVE